MTISSDTQAKPVSVLLVEDEALISEWVKDTLTDDGFDVVAVSNASEALDYLRYRPDVDVLFTDINLPGTMDGSLLALAARDLRPNLKVIYASGRVQGIDPKIRVPGSTFVPKPYMPSQISAILSKIAPEPHRHAG